MYLRNRTHPIAPAAAGQTTDAPSLATKSISISPVTTTANPITGASRIRAAVANPDAQFRTLRIAPSRIRSPVSQWRCSWVVDRAISGPLERGMAPCPRPYSARLARHRLVRHALQGPEHYLIRSGSELGHLVRLRSGESTACRAPGVCAGAASDARVRFRGLPVRLRRSGHLPPAELLLLPNGRFDSRPFPGRPSNGAEVRSPIARRPPHPNGTAMAASSRTCSGPK